MHARNRAPGIGYRSPMGMGVGPTSRISPDGGGRGNAMYNSEYRGHNRGFGRGQPKPFQPPQPQPRKGDVFTEAGRLATEYLVAKGILPQNVFSGKWQNGGLKNLIGNFQGLRPQDGDPPTESRPSALGRLGDAGINDMGTSSKRRFPDEYNLAESKDYTRGKRRMDSFRGIGSQRNQELGRSTSWSEKLGVSADKDSNDDSINEYQEEQQVNKENGNGEQKLQSGDIASKNNSSGQLESPHENNQVTDDLASKANSVSTRINHPSESDPDANEKANDMDPANLGTGEMKEHNCDTEMEKQGVIEDSPVHHPAEDNPESKNGSNLLRLCTFAKVPTRTRSSLTIKASKVGSLSITEDENTHESGLSLATGQRSNGPLGNGSLSGTQSLKVDPDPSNMQTKEDAADLSTGSELEQGKCTRSRSFPDRSFMKEQGLNDGAAGYGRSNTMDSWKGEQRSMQHSDSRDGFKKAREWDPVIDTQANMYLSNSVQDLKGFVEGRNTSDEEVAEQKEVLDISLSPSGVAKPGTVCTEEKQLMSGSFKICDLNLMGASDSHENHDDHPVLIYPSNPQKRKNEAGHVDISLSMSNNSITPDKFCRRGANGEEVEVIDLENDCIQDMALNNPDQKYVFLTKCIFKLI